MNKPISGPAVTNVFVKQFPEEDGDFFQSAVFSGNGKFLLVSSSDDDYSQVINVWDLASMEKIYREVTTFEVRRIGISDDGKLLGLYRYGFSGSNASHLCFHGGHYVVEDYNNSPGWVDLYSIPEGRVINSCSGDDIFSLDTPLGEQITLRSFVKLRDSQEEKEVRRPKEYSRYCLHFHLHGIMAIFDYKSGKSTATRESAFDHFVAHSTLPLWAGWNRENNLISVIAYAITPEDMGWMQSSSPPIRKVIKPKEEPPVKIVEKCRETDHSMSISKFVQFFTRKLQQGKDRIVEEKNKKYTVVMMGLQEGYKMLYQEEIEEHTAFQGVTIELVTHLQAGELITYLETNHVDLLVVEHSLQERKWGELSYECKKQFPHIPVLVLSTWELYLPSPFDGDAFLIISMNTTEFLEYLEHFLFAY